MTGPAFSDVLAAMRLISALSAVLLVACASQSPNMGDPERVPHAPPGGTAASASISSAAPVASAMPAVSATAATSVVPVAEAPIRCAEACGAGTKCALTKRGAACVECAPGSIPSCKDDQFVAACGDDGALQKTTDCFAQSKRCVSGTCQSRVCDPNALHCHEGNVYKCNASGTARALMKTCMTPDGTGGLTLNNGVCQVRRGAPGCFRDCNEPDSTILALFGCTACEPPPDNFCATVGKQGCNDRICRKWPDQPKAGIGGPFGVEGECERETEGLAVPGSDQRGACEGPGPIGERVVSYQVCRGGQPVAATRKQPCQR